MKSLKCIFGFHQTSSEPLVIAMDEFQFWNCENVDREVDYEYKLVKCSRCGKEVWVEISWREYMYYREHGFTRKIEGDDRPKLHPNDRYTVTYAWTKTVPNKKTGDEK